LVIILYDRMIQLTWRYWSWWRQRRRRRRRWWRCGCRRCCHCSIWMCNRSCCISCCTWFLSRDGTNND